MLNQEAAAQWVVEEAVVNADFDLIHVSSEDYASLGQLLVPVLRVGLIQVSRAGLPVLSSTHHEQ